MTAIRQEAMEMLERVPETNAKKVIDLDQFVMSATERGQDADNYIRELRDNDRI